MVAESMGRPPRDTITHLHTLSHPLLLSQAYLYHRRRKEQQQEQQAQARGDSGGGGGDPEAAARFALLEATRAEAANRFPALEQGLRAQGWDLDGLLLSPEGWVYHDT